MALRWIKMQVNTKTGSVWCNATKLVATQNRTEGKGRSMKIKEPMHKQYLGIKPWTNKLMILA
eukprot:scaffold20491_cov21-Tisochrysis_lutea.AAC.1